MSDSNPTRKVRSWWRAALLVAAALVVIVLLALVILKPQLEQVFANVNKGDCQWARTVTVWNDANADGLRDADESPLAGVLIAVDDMKLQSPRVASGTTDTTGAAPLSVFVPGCPETAMRISAEAPAGFCLTTPNNVEDVSGEPLAFGLVAC